MPDSTQLPTQLTGGFGQGVGFVHGVCFVASAAASQGTPPLAAGVEMVNTEVLLPDPSQGASHVPVSDQEPTQLTGDFGQGVGFVQGSCLVAPAAASHGAPPLAAGVVTW